MFEAETASAVCLPPLLLSQPPSCFFNTTLFQSFPGCGFLKLKIISNSHRRRFYVALRWSVKGVWSGSGWVAGPAVALICKVGELESMYTQCAHADTHVYFLYTDRNKVKGCTFLLL